MSKINFHGTTIIAIKKDNTVAMAGDGQVSIGNTIMKANAKKVRRLFKDKIQNPILESLKNRSKEAPFFKKGSEECGLKSMGNFKTSKNSSK